MATHSRSRDGHSTSPLWMLEHFGSNNRAAVGQRDDRAMAEEARPKLSIKTERPVGQHVVPPSPTTLLDNGASRAP